MAGRHSNHGDRIGPDMLPFGTNNSGSEVGKAHGTMPREFNSEVAVRKEAADSETPAAVLPIDVKQLIAAAKKEAKEEGIREGALQVAKRAEEETKRLGRQIKELTTKLEEARIERDQAIEEGKVLAALPLTPVNTEAADRIELLEAELAQAREILSRPSSSMEMQSRAFSVSQYIKTLAEGCAVLKVDQMIEVKEIDARAMEKSFSEITENDRVYAESARDWLTGYIQALYQTKLRHREARAKGRPAT